MIRGPEKVLKLTYKHIMYESCPELISQPYLREWREVISHYSLSIFNNTHKGKLHF